MEETLVTNVLWRGIEPALGAEHCTLRRRPDGGYRLGGTVVFATEEDGTPTTARYDILTDNRWRTRQVTVALADRGTGIRLLTDGTGHWWVPHGDEVPELERCLDVDLRCTPATNALAVNRLELPIGASGEVRTAYIEVPSLRISFSEQRYERIDEDLYLFTAGDFTAEIRVDEHGLVVDYEGNWERGS